MCLTYYTISQTELFYIYVISILTISLIVMFFFIKEDRKTIKTLDEENEKLKEINNANRSLSNVIVNYISKQEKIVDEMMVIIRKGQSDG